jgi:hypothetical protein
VCSFMLGVGKSNFAAAGVVFELVARGVQFFGGEEELFMYSRYVVGVLLQCCW